MHFSLLLPSLLPLLASANPLPLESRQSTLQPFSLIAARSGSPIHLSSINANGESFWIGKNTASYCPSAQVPDCPAGIYTELLAGDGGASMYTEVPGGQTVYVLPTGALAFTLAHAGGQVSTNNGTATGFTLTPGADGALGAFGFGGLGSTGFLACPAKNATAPPWQVFADVEGIRDSSVPGGNVSACLGFDALGAPADAGVLAAWEYV